MAEKEPQKLYLVEYWKNDGGWYDAGDERTPKYTFYAQDDVTALTLAKGFIQQGRGFSRTGYETFRGKYLAEVLSQDKNISLENISFRVFCRTFTAEPGYPSPDTIRKLKETKFSDFDLTNLVSKYFGRKLKEGEH